MRAHSTAIVFVLGIAGLTSAQDVVLEGTLPDDVAAYSALPFEVPEGTVEIEVRHDDLSEANVLDWGLVDPERFRGWGGGNAEPAIVGERAASRSYFPGAMPAGTWGVLVGAALIEERPAPYRVEIFFRTEATLEPQTREPYAPVVAISNEARWYAGDFHVHSRESGDARPTLDEVATFARSRGLDFVELSEHNTLSSLELVNEAQRAHPELLFLPGAEVTTYQGHANTIGVTSHVDFRVASGLGVDGASMSAATRAQGGLFALNHPNLDLGSLCLGCAWELPLEASAIDAIEIQNGAWSVTGAFFFIPTLRRWDALLAEGGRIAAIGGSDDHRAGRDLDSTQSPIGSPTTMVFAERLDVAAILEGVRSGRTVVKLEGPDDPMVELEATHASGRARLGDELSGNATLIARVTGAPIGAVLRFMRNGVTDTQVEVDADPFEATLEITPPPGDVDDRWRAQLDVDRNPRVVTSHLYVRATGEPPVDAGPPRDASTGGTGGGGGCGCRSAEGSSASGFALLALVVGLTQLRRRRD